MKRLSEEVFINALKELGLQERDVLFIHSDLSRFGVPENIELTDLRKGILKFYHQGFNKVIGEEGTLAVPAYFYEYARYSEKFDPKYSPVSVSLGSFSQYVASLTDSFRSLNPLQSIAAVGLKAHSIAGGASLMGYGVTSPWQKLLELNAKIIFLGAPFLSMTFVHHIEQLVGVPHLYFKLFATSIAGQNNHPISAVRYLDYEIKYDLSRFQYDLEKAHLLKIVKIDTAEMILVHAQDAYETGVKGLLQNPYYFLKEAPKFIAGKIPFDGATGK